MCGGEGDWCVGGLWWRRGRGGGGAGSGGRRRPTHYQGPNRDGRRRWYDGGTGRHWRLGRSPVMAAPSNDAGVMAGGNLTSPAASVTPTSQPPTTPAWLAHYDFLAMAASRCPGDVGAAYLGPTIFLWHLGIDEPTGTLTANLGHNGDGRGATTTRLGGGVRPHPPGMATLRFLDCTNCRRI